jgi:hypothetical protein
MALCCFRQRFRGHSIVPCSMGMCCVRATLQSPISIVVCVLALCCVRATLQRLLPLLFVSQPLCCVRATLHRLFPFSFVLCPYFVSVDFSSLSSCLYKLQMGGHETLVLFPHLQSPWCSVTQGPFLPDALLSKTGYKDPLQTATLTSPGHPFWPAHSTG